MNFWDTSALVPLILDQALSSRALEYFREESLGIFVWWGTYTECVSAIARLEREQLLSNGEAEQALRALAELATHWNEVLPSDMVRERANRLLRLHPLRTADAFQLAGAIVASEDLASRVAFVSFDERLAIAARKEGFSVRD